MRHFTFYSAAAALLVLSSAASATTFTFNTDPFAGTNVLNTPGRQVVGGEDFVPFSIADDVLSLDSTIFDVGPDLNFVNTSAQFLAPGGENVIVLETFDNDNNLATPFGAGNAADLIADQITTPGAGFFIYFNQSLNLPRLVYSTDLSSNTADLKVLARFINLTGVAGQNVLPTFTAANFEFTSAAAAPEPSSLGMMLSALGVGGYLLWRKRSRT
jgi:hypothetical protein